MKIRVLHHRSFTPEKRYIIELLTSRFAGVELEFISGSDRGEYRFEFENGKLLRINDAFWSEHEEPAGYLKRDALPDGAGFHEAFIAGKKLPVVRLYGDESIREDERGYYLGTDIPASAFFMVTRWEELVVKVRDEHDRFPDNEAAAVRFGFYDRPIVDEYTELLRSIFSKLSGKEVQYSTHYRCFLTHDVDDLYLYRPFSRFAEAAGGDVIKRKSLPRLGKSVAGFAGSLMRRDRDPGFSFDYLMRISEKNGLRSHFYFIPGYKGEFDCYYDIRSRYVKNLIAEMNQRGHVVGMHGSYNSFGNFKQLRTEWERLLKVGGDAISGEGRQHYLRLSIPETWRDWGRLGMSVDSSVGYHDHVGFRAGICREFPVFDVLARERSGFTERPLIAMEVAVRRAVHGVDEFAEKIIKTAETVKRYGGDFVILWHNRNINHANWEAYGREYENIVREIKE